MAELTITTSGPKPVKLLSSGKKKTGYVVIASALLEEGGKVTLKVEGPTKDDAEELLGTIKLGDVIVVDIAPETPE
jgi:hypothetical protein